MKKRFLKNIENVKQKLLHGDNVRGGYTSRKYAGFFANKRRNKKMVGTVKKGYTLVELIIVIVIVGLGTLVVSNGVQGFVDLYMKVNNSSTLQHNISSLGNFQNYANEFFRGCDRVVQDDGTVSQTDMKCFNKEDKKFYRINVINKGGEFQIVLFSDNMDRALHIFSAKKGVGEIIEFKTLSDIYKLFYLEIEIPATRQNIYFTIKN